MAKHRITNQKKNGILSEGDRYRLGELLLRAGYAVKIGKEKPADKPNAPYTHYVEYWEE